MASFTGYSLIGGDLFVIFFLAFLVLFTLVAFGDSASERKATTLYYLQLVCRNPSRLSLELPIQK